MVTLKLLVLNQCFTGTLLKEQQSFFCRMKRSRTMPNVYTFQKGLHTSRVSSAYLSSHSKMSLFAVEMKGKRLCIVLIVFWLKP